VAQTGSQVGGQATITLTGTLQDGASGAMSIVINGRLASGGGVQMQSSSVSTGPSDDPTRYKGTVTTLQGTAITAALTDTTGQRITAQWQIEFAPNGAGFTGTMTTT
jgi:hypothetical protein